MIKIFILFSVKKKETYKKSKNETKNQNFEKIEIQKIDPETANLTTLQNFNMLEKMIADSESGSQN